MTTLERVLYTANVRATSGREVAPHSDDGRLASSFRLLEAPAPAPTQNNYSLPVGRLISRGDKPATHTRD